MSLTCELINIRSRPEQQERSQEIKSRTRDRLIHRSWNTNTH